MVAIQVFALITVSPDRNPTISVLYWLLPLSILIALFMIFLMGYYIVQYVVISEEEIKVRCLWFTIRKLKWEEIKEIRYERFCVSIPGGVTSGRFVFDDGIERKQIGNGNMLRKKANYITLTASKRAGKIIEIYWRKPIVENRL